MKNTHYIKSQSFIITKLKESNLLAIAIIGNKICIVLKQTKY